MAHSANSSSNKLEGEVTTKTGALDITKLMNATLTGNDPEQVAYGKTGIVDESSAAEFSESLDDSPLDALENEAGQESDEYEGNEAEQAEHIAASEREEDQSGEPSILDQLDSKEKPGQAEDIEYVRVTDETGRKRKVKIDFSDRKAITNAFKQAAGMRKFQAERDNLKKELSAVSEQFSEVNDAYEKLNNAFGKEGVKGVVKLLAGADGIEKFIEEELAHKEYLANLTPNEKYRLEMEEKERSWQERLEAERLQREEFEKKFQQREEEAAIRQLESKLHPAFDRYRFAGKLNDPVTENHLDKAIWKEVTDRLAEYPEDVELTPALVDKEVRQAAAIFNKVIKAQTEKKVKSTITKKKNEASKRAQVAATKGLGGDAEKRKFVSNMKSGNITDAFSQMFSGKVKI